MPTLHIVFNPTGGTSFMVKYRPEPVAYGSTLPWVEVGPFINSPIDITVPYLIPYEFCIKKICGINGGGIQQESWEVCDIANPESDCQVPGFNFVSRNGGDFTFSYTLQPNQPIFQIQVLDPNGIQIAWQTLSASTTPSPFIFNIPSLLSGIYQFRIRGMCGNNKFTAPASNWTAYVNVTVAVSGCVAPTDIVEQICQNVVVTNSGQPMPNAVSGAPYKHILFLTGTPPFTFVFDTVPTPPAWLSANYVLDISGNNTIELTGTPANIDVGVPQGLKLKIKNCGNDYDNGGVKFTGNFEVLLGVLIQEFTINNTTSSSTEIDLLINSVNVSGHRTIAASGNIVVNASGSLINNVSSEVVVTFPLGLLSYPATANLVYTSGTISGTWNNTLKTFTFIGINTTVAQALVINLIP